MITFPKPHTQIREGDGEGGEGCKKSRGTQLILNELNKIMWYKHVKRAITWQ